VVTPFYLSDHPHADPLSSTRAFRQRAQRHHHLGEQLQTDAHRKYRPQIAGEVTHRTENTLIRAATSKRSYVQIVPKLPFRIENVHQATCATGLCLN
jgi:hypothetical protein